jgi:hypothetical protein
MHLLTAEVDKNVFTCSVFFLATNLPVQLATGMCPALHQDAKLSRDTLQLCQQIV